MATLIALVRNIRGKITILGTESPRWCLCMKLKSSKGPSILSFSEASTKYCNLFLSAKNSSCGQNTKIIINWYTQADTLGYKSFYACVKLYFSIKFQIFLLAFYYYFYFYFTPQNAAPWHVPPGADRPSRPPLCYATAQGCKSQWFYDKHSCPQRVSIPGPCALQSGMLLLDHCDLQFLWTSYSIDWYFLSDLRDAGGTVAIKMTSECRRQTGEVHSGICRSYSRLIPFMFLNRCNPFQLPPAPLATFPSSTMMQLANLLLALMLSHMDRRD